jgi:hypothetical protein
MGMHPRWLKADSVYAQTQRTVDRQFFFKPDPVTRNIIGASAARAQMRHPVKIFWLEFNINHEQNGIAAMSSTQKDLDNLVNFKRLFHRLIAVEINIYLDRDGAVFSSPARSVECVDNQSAEQQFFYAVTNPVKDGLVEKVSHWKGFSSYAALALGEEEVYTYYDRTAWHRAGGKKSKKPLEAFVKKIRLTYTPLPGWEGMKASQRQAMIRRECRELEQRFEEERQRSRSPAMGVEKLERVDHRDRPKTRPTSGRKPLCHASTAEGAKTYKESLLEFLNAYRIASAYYRSGVLDVAFPAGSIRPPLIYVQT